MPEMPDLKAVEFAKQWLAMPGPTHRFEFHLPVLRNVCLGFLAPCRLWMRAQKGKAVLLALSLGSYTWSACVRCLAVRLL